MTAANPETPVLLSSIPFSSMTRRTARERSASLLKKEFRQYYERSAWNKFQTVNRIKDRYSIVSRSSFPMFKLDELFIKQLRRPYLAGCCNA